MAKKYVLGIDNGLSLIKAVLFDIDGHFIGKSYKKNCLKSTHDNLQVEKDMAELWNETAGVIREVLKKTKVDPADIIGVGNSAHGNGIYLLDKDDKVFTAAIMSMDHRANKIIEEYKKSGVVEKIQEYTLQIPWEGQPGPILRWMKEEKRAWYDRIGKIFTCKDWIKWNLTGKYTTDFTDATSNGWMDNRQKCYSKELLALLGIDEMYALLPPVYNSDEICGSVTAKAAKETGLCEGTPVIGGMFDVVACAIGAGITDEESYFMVAGTWGINAAIQNQWISSKNVVQSSAYAGKDMYIVINSSPTSTVNLEWYLKIWNADGEEKSYEKANAAAAKFKAEDVKCIFLPYVFSPMNYPNLHAGFINLDVDTTRDEMLRSVYEGIVLGHKDQIKKLEKEGIYRNKVVLTGGATNSSFWCQLYADILGMPVYVPKVQETGAWGAAMLAIAVNSEKEAMTREMKPEYTVYLPNEKETLIYEKKYKVFCDYINREIGEEIVWH